MTSDQAAIETEEQLVAELGHLGVGYLSHQLSNPLRFKSSPEELLRRLVCQPSSRVRLALISLMLARPDYAQYALKALEGLPPKEAQRLRIFYTAAVILQQKYSVEIQKIHRMEWSRLPDFFSKELGLTKVSPEIPFKASGTNTCPLEW